ncbi:respiratory nitrite reductase (cytochrome ammonia-forming) precursor [Neorhodopirellula lusitana]|uniref:nitrite reductase (cytochrome; ammonia-forming) n=1 Tax=Neorhodopirellula lusitana TaxID=445327 RepID=A0ABY1PTQ5_9BACT|nr:ammonia-forming cytochrome c nitrite reductase subunit c552 [Neorhodopirellula lusitana]SMP47473.1 respiratory nitrite reductase (cytochrome ammonia-forming) precursor [Neorhodopirellula lusitana]
MATSSKRSFGWLLALVGLVAFATFGVVALLVNIFERKQEARKPFVRLVEVNEVSTDPKPWGVNFPLQYESYLRTADTERTTYGGNHSMSPSKLKEFPWLKRLYAGYAFSIEYREARGHAYMLGDQEVTKRVTEVQQAGACLHCHAAIAPTYRRVGLEKMGKDASEETLGESFDQEAVIAGFKALSQMKYEEVHAELTKTPDGVVKAAEGDPHLGDAHPVSCVDCHDPETMSIRVTRPGFILGIAKLAESDDPVPHLPSIQKWRDSKSKTPYDPNVDATRQEMRSFVCGQCHVEYYCANKMTLTFPWSNGLKVEDLEKEWEETTFPDTEDGKSGGEFYDYVHKETGTPVFKAQHPEFELWSQGIHARAGVSCSDCHMPYERQGATKVSSHWVRSPMLNINKACQTCHHVSEDELKARVDTIQGRTQALMARAASAMTDMLDAIVLAQKAGASEEDLKPIRELQRKAMWRLDYISSENSKGFHADQEAARILGESIDYSRQAQAAAYRLGGSPKPEEGDVAVSQAD